MEGTVKKLSTSANFDTRIFNRKLRCIYLRQRCHLHFRASAVFQGINIIFDASITDYNPFLWRQLYSMDPSEKTQEV